MYYREELTMIVSLLMGFRGMIPKKMLRTNSAISHISKYIVANLLNVLSKITT